MQGLEKRYRPHSLSLSLKKERDDYKSDPIAIG